MKRAATLVLTVGAAVTLVLAACSSDDSGTNNGAKAGAAGSSSDAGGDAAAGGGGSAGAQGCPGVAGAAGGLADAGVCAITTPIPACTECINQKCLNECKACAEKPECKAAFNCVLTQCYLSDGGLDMNCAVNGCVSTCTPGLSELIAFWQGTAPGCVATNCTMCPNPPVP